MKVIKAITKNEKTLNIVQDVGERGEWKGEPFLRMEPVTPANLVTFVGFLTPEYVCATLNARETAYGQLVTDKAIKPLTRETDNPEVDWEKAIEFLTDRSTRTETLDELVEMKVEKFKEQQTLVGMLQDALTKGEVVINAGTENEKKLTSAEFVLELQKLRDEMDQLQGIIDEKKESYKGRGRKPKKASVEVGTPEEVEEETVPA